MKKNLTGIGIMLVAAVFTAIGQMHWKLGLNHVDTLFDIFATSENFGKVIPYIISGFVLYGCGSALMIVAYKFGDVSMLHPLLGVSYILSLIIGFSLLGETINAQKIIAVIVIITGLFFLGWSAYDIEKKKGQNKSFDNDGGERKHAAEAVKTDTLNGDSDKEGSV